MSSQSSLFDHETYSNTTDSHFFFSVYIACHVKYVEFIETVTKALEESP